MILLEYHDFENEENSVWGAAIYVWWVVRLPGLDAAPFHLL